MALSDTYACLGGTDCTTIIAPSPGDPKVRIGAVVSGSADNIITCKPESSGTPGLYASIPVSPTPCNALRFTSNGLYVASRYVVTGYDPIYTNIPGPIMAGQSADVNDAFTFSLDACDNYGWWQCEVHVNIYERTFGWPSYGTIGEGHWAHWITMTVNGSPSLSRNRVATAWGANPGWDRMGNNQGLRSNPSQENAKPNQTWELPGPTTIIDFSCPDSAVVTFGMTSRFTNTASGPGIDATLQAAQLINVNIGREVYVKCIKTSQ